MAGTTEKPDTVEMVYQAKLGQRSVSLQVQENRADIRVLDGYLKKLDRGGEWAAIWIDRLEIEGPFYNKERRFFEKLIHPEMPARGKKTMVWTDDKAQELIERFAFEAYRRRAPAPDFVDRLVNMFVESRASGQKFEVAMGEVLGVILASPGFLFLQENSDVDKMKRQLDERELAIRLAYFLWSSPPDEELYAIASEGSLSKKGVLNKQVERMLNDPKSASFVDGFTSQWAELQRFDAITVDESKYFRFNKGVRHSAYREVLEFFGTLVKENLPASNLIDSEFVVINSQLGEHYGIEGVKSNAFTKVNLPADSPRGGLLGQTAFLTMGSTGERSSPVIRGALVMEKLLHDKPAPPPPNVPELGAATKEPLTNRQLVELHQRKAQCASCHKKMDVIGFGLENFDVIAKWRETEKVGKKEVSIEPGGKLPGGGEFANLDELKAELLKEKSHLAEELVESLLAYGLGRTIEFSDSEAVSQILQSLEGDDYRVRSMIHQITASPLFRIK